MISVIFFLNFASGEHFHRNLSYFCNLSAHASYPEMMFFQHVRSPITYLKNKIRVQGKAWNGEKAGHTRSM